MTLDDFLERLPQPPRPRRSGQGYVALCPGHHDTEASLSVTERDGKILVRCFKGCRAQEVVEALSLTLADLFVVDSRSPSAPSAPSARIERREVAAYEYSDPTGAVLYQNVRYEPKDFRQRRPDGRGGWTWALGDVRRVVYRLPELAEQQIVYLVEGEKDADRLWSLGLPATTSAGGAKSWRPEYADQIARAGVREVLVIPDNDEPGHGYAKAAAADLQRLGLRVVVVRLPGLGPITVKHGEDISDWLDAGHTLEELAGAIEEQREATASKLPIPLSRLFARPPVQPAWLVKDLIRERTNGWIGAGAKVGKSFLALDFLLSCALGASWLDQFEIARPLTVVLIEEEDDEWRIYDRSLKLCRGRGCEPPATFHVSIRAGYRLDDEQALAPLIAWFQDIRPDLIVWDVFNRLHLRDERKPDQIMPVLWRLDQLRNEIGCANLLAHHSRKPGTAGPDLASGGQRLRGPSEFWGWAENSLYLSPLKGKGNLIVEPESKDAIIEPFKAHLEDTAPDARRWIFDGTVQAKVDKGNETRQRILEVIAPQPQTAEQIADAVKVTARTVKAHLKALQAEGLAEFVKEPGKAGRRLWMPVAASDGVKPEDGVK